MKNVERRNLTRFVCTFLVNAAKMLFRWACLGACTGTKWVCVWAETWRLVLKIFWLFQAGSL